MKHLAPLLLVSGLTAQVHYEEVLLPRYGMIWQSSKLREELRKSPLTAVDVHHVEQGLEASVPLVQARACGALTRLVREDFYRKLSHERREAVHTQVLTLLDSASSEVANASEYALRELLKQGDLVSERHRSRMFSEFTQMMVNEDPDVRRQKRD